MILNELKKKGIEVSLVDDNHIALKPKEKITKDILLRIKAEKTKIIQRLKQNQNEITKHYNNVNLVDIEVIKPYTNDKGVSYAPGETISTYPFLAQRLINEGIAKPLSRIG